MREIKYHNDETIKVDGLHFYGCSFVAGQELLDEEMGSPMSIPVEQMARQKNESVEQYYKRKLSRELLFKKKIKLESQLAWPQYMCNTLKVRCFNHATHGASMTEIKGRLFNDVIEGNISSSEAVDVGLTGFAREMIFSENTSGQEMWKTREGGVRSMVVATDYERRGDNDFARKYMDLKGTFTLFYYFLHEIYSIINLCKINDIKFYLIPMLDRFESEFYEKQFDFDIKSQEFSSHIDFLESEIDKYIIIGTKVDPLGGNIIKRLPRGHPCIESHEKYGIKVGKKLLT